MKLTRQDRLDAVAVLILRVGLIWFLFLWAAHKLITPKQYQTLARHFDGVEIEISTIQFMGIVQIALLVVALVGIFRPFSYGAIALMHAFTVQRQWERFLDPFALSERGFPINRNPVISLAALAAFIALVLLIHRDHYSVGGWLRQRGRGKWWL